jgi:hypothetical protein
MCNVDTVSPGFWKGLKIPYEAVDLKCAFRKMLCGGTLNRVLL